jgi:adenosine deaminase
MRNFSRWTAAALLTIACAAAAHADERATAARFEQAKGSEPALIAFLKGMPKGGDLHNHVSGAVTTEVLVEAAIRNNLYFDPSDSQFYQDNNTAGTRVPAAKFAADDTLIAQYMNKASMRGWNPAQETGHDHFFTAFDYIYSSGATSDEMLDDVIQGAKADNEQYMELMTGIVPGDAWGKLAPVTDVSDLNKALDALLPTLPQFAASSKAFLDTRDQHFATLFGEPDMTTGASGPINIRYIFSTSRNQPNESFFQSLAAAFYTMQSDPRIVGINIVAPEDYRVARLNFEKQMQIIHFLHTKFPKGHITLHAGELTPTLSPIDVMRSRIRKSIEEGDAERIGHGVSIGWEDDLPQLFAEMRQRGTAVEICLTSNASILGVEGDRHPWSLYRSANIPLCLATDDEGVSRSNLTLEYTRAVRSYKLTYPELKDLARNSIEYSFLPGDSLYVGHAYTKLRPAFIHARDAGGALTAAAKQELQSSQKAAKEWELERDFVAFEK